MSPTATLRGALLASLLLATVGCATAPPTNPENICSIFREHRHWHDSAQQMNKRWGVPVQVPMAIMYQESSFRHDARPPKKYIFGFIPNGRVSSAYGYSQALDGTWSMYKKSTRQPGAQRADFHDSLDFMGWYIDQTARQNKVSKWDANKQYLNYHDGWGGYRRGSYHKKPWLKTVALKVDERSRTYAAQYASCKEELSKGFWGRLFS